MKKFLALLLALVMAFSLVACGGDKTPADNQQGDNNGDSQYPEYFAGMDQLIADAQAEGELTVYGSCEEEYLTAACQPGSTKSRKPLSPPISSPRRLLR